MLGVLRSQLKLSGVNRIFGLMFNKASKFQQRFSWNKFYRIFFLKTHTKWNLTQKSINCKDVASQPETLKYHAQFTKQIRTCHYTGNLQNYSKRPRSKLIIKIHPVKTHPYMMSVYIRSFIDINDKSMKLSIGFTKS